MLSVQDNFSGGFLLILILAFLFAFPLCFLFINLYKKKLIKGMGYQSNSFTSIPQTSTEIKAATTIAPEFKVIELATLPDNTSTVYYKLKETLGCHWFVYIGMCLAFGGVIGWCYLQSMDALGYWKFLYTLLVFSFPIIPISFLLLANGWKQKLILLALFLFLVVCLSYIIWAKAADNAAYSTLLLPILIYNSVPILLVFLFRIQQIKAIGMLLFTFFIFCFSGPILLSLFLLSHAQILKKLGFLFIGAGLSASITLLIWTMVSFIFGALIGWVLFIQIKRGYLKKWFNDIQLHSDAIAILFNITYAIFISFNSRNYAYLSLLAFPIYKLFGYIFFYFLRKRKIKEVSPRMLLLRVFALGDDSRNLFERLLKHWRYAGSIQMISGPDLATTAIEPHEAIAFVSGQLDNTFCEDAASIEKNIGLSDNSPDQDGTHRVNEFFCRDNNWKEVLAQLVNHSDIILMDLRKFSEQFKGCKYEIEALINLVSLDKIIFVIDHQTDLAFTEKVMTNAFQMVSNNSPNLSISRPIELYLIDNRHDKNVFKLLNLVCSKID